MLTNMTNDFGIYVSHWTS